MALRIPLRSVVTGGPGAGKSSLITLAGNSGLVALPEVAREILQSPGGMEMRAERPLDFAKAMLQREIEAFEDSAGHSAPVIFDRGFPDIAGFLELSGLPVPPAVDRACRELRYEGPIFHAPPWQDIYEPDPERIQTWQEALESDAAIVAAWKHYGYDLVKLPLVPPEQRLAFVMRQMGRG